MVRGAAAVARPAPAFSRPTFYGLRVLGGTAHVLALGLQRPDRGVGQAPRDVSPWALGLTALGSTAIIAASGYAARRGLGGHPEAVLLGHTPRAMLLEAGWAIGLCLGLLGGLMPHAPRRLALSVALACAATSFIEALPRRGPERRADTATRLDGARPALTDRWA